MSYLYPQAHHHHVHVLVQLDSDIVEHRGGGGGGAPITSTACSITSMMLVEPIDQFNLFPAPQTSSHIELLSKWEFTLQ